MASIRESEEDGGGIVAQTASRLRDRILAHAEGANIGSLNGLAGLFGVGIATVQQAARILEYEGLLEVRRGPNGGYFSRRPDAATLKRSIATFVRVNEGDPNEVLDIMLLLDAELMIAATECPDEGLRRELRKLRARLDDPAPIRDRAGFETDLHEVIFAMVRRPMTEMLLRVSLQFYGDRPIPEIFVGAKGALFFRNWRRDMIDAILASDSERIQFEAYRYRRRIMRSIARISEPAADEAARESMSSQG